MVKGWSASILWEGQEGKDCRTDYTMLESWSYRALMGSCTVLVLDPIFLLPHNLHLTVAQAVGHPHPWRWEEQLYSRKSRYRQRWMAFHCGYTGAECKTLNCEASAQCLSHATWPFPQRGWESPQPRELLWEKKWLGPSLGSREIFDKLDPFACF